VVYFVSALGAVALHKTGLIFAAACALWSGWEVARGKRRIRELGLPAATLAVALGVLLLKAYPPPPEYGRANSLLEIPYTLMTFVGGYSFGPSLTDIQSHGAWGAVSQNLVQIGVLGGVLALLGLAYLLHFGSLTWGKETSLLLVNVGFVAVAALITTFPYNVRYTLPALLAFVALVAALSTCTRWRILARLAVLGVLVVGLWADVQWFTCPAYRKGDSRAVAQWLLANQAQVKSWTVLPDYLRLAVEWYLQGRPEMLAREQLAAGPQTTSFPPVPDVLIIGRRHHIQEPDKLIAAYQTAAGEVQTVLSIAGFEPYSRAAGGER
jgi:hypothetical protein